MNSTFLSVLYIMQCKMVLTFDETLKCDYSNES